MPEVETTKEILPEPKRPVTPLEFHDQILEEAGGDLSQAVGSIDDQHDAMNFALGHTQSLMQGEAYNENHSAAAASAEIIVALAKAIGPKTEGYEAENFSRQINLWRPNFNILKRAQDTPGMWRCLMEGKDFEEISKRDNVPYRRLSFLASQVVIAQAQEHLAQAA